RGLSGTCWGSCFTPRLSLRRGARWDGQFAGRGLCGLVESGIPVAPPPTANSLDKLILRGSGRRCSPGTGKEVHRIPETERREGEMCERRSSTACTRNQGRQRRLNTGWTCAAACTTLVREYAEIHHENLNPQFMLHNRRLARTATDM